VISVRFGAKVKALRQSAGLKQRELASKVGIDITYVSKIECGVMPPPSEKVILKMAEVLHSDKDDLITAAGKIPSDIAPALNNAETLIFLKERRLHIQNYSDRNNGVKHEKTVGLP
jgi:HTH-type transcriptional regulator, competence development regulator